MAVFKDNTRLPCRIHDISQTGARLIFEAEGAIPDRFLLEIEGNEKVVRRCAVVHRDGHEIGVTFPDRGLKA